MSDSGRDTSVRHLPPGKLQNIKRLFEDGEKDKTDKPVPPARPQALPAKFGSPARQPAIKKYPAPQAPGRNLSDSESKEEFKNRKFSGDSGQSFQGAQPSSKVAERISCLETAVSSQGNISTTSTASSSGSSQLKASKGHSVESVSDGLTEAANGLQGIRVQRAQSDVSDLYAQVNKSGRNPENHKVAFPPKSDLQRKEAVRKNSDERRKTVAAFSSEVGENVGNSVATRARFYDGQKPSPPVKPEAVKRQHSMRTAQELGHQKSLETEGSHEGEYNLPWDLNKSSVVEKLMNQCKSSSSAVINATKSDPHTQKPPLPNQPPKLSEAKSQRKQSHESGNEVRRNSGQPKISENAPDQPGLTRAAAPPKPPRTHAHDDYLKNKNAQSESKPNSEALVKKASGVDRGKDNVVEAEYLSVKDRISKMRQQTSSPPLSSSKDQGVLMRHPPPSRPPPPKLRPNSGGTPTKEISWPTKPRPITHAAVPHEEGPVVIPLSPNSQKNSATLFHRKAGQSRDPSDELPYEPGQGKRFPLRKSYSSECLHSSRGSSLNAEDDSGTQMTCSNYDTDYEAVLDPDGYAIPHEFLKIKRKRQFSGQNDDVNENVSPAQFLTKLQGFGKDPESEKNGLFGEPWVTSTQEQTLDKVTKKKMTMVKQKINQAYSDVSITFRCVDKQTDHDQDWVQVEKDNSADAEIIVEPTVLRKRIEYCATVRLKTSKSIKKSKEYLSAIYPQLFEYCLIVGLQTSTDKGYKPFVIHKFPENVSSNLSVPSFCFPDAAYFKPGSGTNFGESYSFVMTYEDGTRVYGYCRRMQPPDSSLPEVICIISPIDAFNMYNTLLAEIEKRRRISIDLAAELIAASFGRPLPKPGKVCHIRTLDSSGEMETIYLNRPSDNKLENVNYESPLRFLGTDKLVKVFASMLMERRIILCSSHLSVLTQTVHALAALLYPFQWQHVYVPLLPSEMLDVVCAPMPYIIGVMTVFLPQVLKMDIEKVFVVDLDKKDIIKSEGDESTLIPRKIQKALKTAINMCKIDSEAQNAQWLIVAESFLRMFIETIGHFTHHIQTQQDGNRIFQKEGFITDIVSKEHRQFLEWFTETQMFEVFIGNHVEQTDYGTSDLFMQRLTEYRESKEEIKRKGLGAKVKNFINKLAS